MASSRQPGPLGTAKELYTFVGRSDRKNRYSACVQGTVPGPTGWGRGADAAKGGSRGANAAKGVDYMDDRTFHAFVRRLDLAEEAVIAINQRADGLASILNAPYKDRLNILINNVTGRLADLTRLVRDIELRRRVAFSESHQIGLLMLEGLEDATRMLYEVVEAWEIAVRRARIFEWIADFAESRVYRARALEREIRSLHAELEDLQAVIGGSLLREVAFQATVDAALLVAVPVLALLFPPAGLAIGIAGTLVGLTADHFLGPSGFNPFSPGLAVSGTNTATELIPSFKLRLGRAARVLKRVGLPLTIHSDATEADLAVQMENAARLRCREVGARLEQVIRKLDDLRWLLGQPRLVNEIVDGLRREAQILRDYGQVEQTPGNLGP